MRKITPFIIALFFLLPAGFSAEIKEEIYSRLTTHPSFMCPADSIRCQLYKTIDGMNRQLDPPLLVEVCQASEMCEFINDIGASLGFRLLPGDICLSAAQFKGYKIIEGELETTTTTTSTTTTTQSNTYTRTCVQKFRGVCIRWERNQGSTTTTLPTTTITFTTTTTTNPLCLTEGSSCSSDSDCCSNVCRQIKFCINPTIHGICPFPIISRICE
jgi:hypothetical protein